MGWRIFLWLFLLESVAGKDLYSLLGVDSSATLQQIKRAYRLKAKLTHPDKISPQEAAGLDLEEINLQFHEISEAYEILSDSKMRRRYDQTGKTPKELEDERQAQARSSSAGFARRGQPFWTFHQSFQQRQQQQQPNIKFNPIYFQVQRQVILCQQLVLTVTGSSHFLNLIQDENDENSEEERGTHSQSQSQCQSTRKSTDDDSLHSADEASEQQKRNEECVNEEMRKSEEKKTKKTLLQRYVLIAFYNSASSNCLNKLQYEIMYPYPFAGFTRTSDQTMHWDEIMLTLKFDLAAVSNDENADMMKLLNQFNLTTQDINESCPIIIFLPRHETFPGNIFSIWKDDPVNKPLEFHEWVWGMLKMTVKITNKTPWVLHHWWIHGNRGNKLADIPVGDSFQLRTFISHAFLYRAAIVEGNALNNQVS